MDSSARISFKVYVFLWLFHSASPSVFSNLPGLDRFCKVTAREKIQCDIHVVNYLEFKDVRKLFFDLPETAHIVLNISCGENGQVRLPWPMKSKNVLELFVENCKVFGFNDADTKFAKFSDRLVSLQMKSCVIESGVLEAIHVFSNQVSKCGQQTLVSLIMKNISYDLVIEPKDFSKLSSNGIMMDSGDVHLKDKLESGQVCRYKDLEVIDISGSPDGMTYFVLPLENSEFPKLTIFNMSNSKIILFPEIFINWEYSFPNLEILDISSNDISAFDLVQSNPDASVSRRVVPLYLNLRNNRLTKVPAVGKQNIPVIVDVRDNPLVCGCDIIAYRTYLKEILKMYPTFKDLLDVTCIGKNDRIVGLLNLSVDNC